MNNKLVSISFPVYNVASFVERSLNSIVNQTYQHIEIIIIDDCGTDNSMDIVRNVLAHEKTKFLIQYVILDKNQGPGNGRNVSIDKANGDYLFFMDSDDELLPDAIEKLVKAIEEDPVDFVKASFKRIYVGQSKESEDVCFQSNKRIKVDDSLMNYCQHNDLLIPVFMWNSLYDIDILRRNNIRCEQRYMEDDLFSFNLLCKSKSCILLTDVTYNYYIHSSSLTRQLAATDIPEKTGEIYAEIASMKYNIINSMNDSLTKGRLFVRLLGESIYKLYSIMISSNISPELKEKYQKQILAFPPLKFWGWTSMSRIERMKLVYYYILSHLSYGMKKILINQLNFRFYKNK